jgi:hypothetical protein
VFFYCGFLLTKVLIDAGITSCYDLKSESMMASSDVTESRTEHYGMHKILDFDSRLGATRKAKKNSAQPCRKIIFPSLSIKRLDDLRNVSIFDVK